MYQPDPFGGQVPHVRGDSAQRWSAISSNDSFARKSVLDFGCAEGYFGFKALMDGARSVVFVDTDPGCLSIIKDRADNNGYKNAITCYEVLPGGSFDIAFCLSLFGTSGVPSLKEFKEMTQVLYISTSGDGKQGNKKLEEVAGNIFSEVKPIHTGYVGRTIYRCKK